MEIIPSMVDGVVTCSAKCRKMRRAYDVIKNAPRFDGKLTLSQYCNERNISRSQFRYRADKGIAHDALLVHECGLRDLESSRSWHSISDCARSLGTSASNVHSALKRGGRVLGVLVARTTPPMESRKK